MKKCHFGPFTVMPAWPDGTGVDKIFIFLNVNSGGISWCNFFPEIPCPYMCQVGPGTGWHGPCQCQCQVCQVLWFTRKGGARGKENHTAPEEVSNDYVRELSHLSSSLSHGDQGLSKFVPGASWHTWHTWHTKICTKSRKRRKMKPRYFYISGGN